MLDPPDGSEVTHNTSINFQHLVLSGAALRELKAYPTARQPSIHLRVSIESIINTTSLLLIQNDLKNLATILLGTDALTDDLNREDEVGQDSVVHGSQCSATGALLRLRCARPVGTLGTGEDAAGGEDENMAIGELLL